MKRGTPSRLTKMTREHRKKRAEVNDRRGRADVVARKRRGKKVPDAPTEE